MIRGKFFWTGTADDRGATMVWARAAAAHTSPFGGLVRMHYTGMLRSTGASDLIARIVRADEHLDAAAFVEVLAPEATFRLGSAPTATGTAAIAAFVEQLFTRLRELRHAIGASWESDGMLAYEGVVHYTFRDGTLVTIPYANVLRLAGPLVSDYRIYLDPGPMPHPAFT